MSDKVTPVYEERRFPPGIGYPVLYGCFTLLIAWLYQGATHADPATPKVAGLSAFLFRGERPFSPWWVLAVIPVAAAVGAWATWQQWHPSTHGDVFPRWARVYPCVLAATTGAWLIYDWHVWFAKAWAVFCILWLVLGACYAVLYFIAERVEIRYDEVPTRGKVDELELRWRKILDATDLDDAAIVSRSTHRAGLVLTLRLNGAMTQDEAHGQTKRIATVAARAYRNVGEPLPTSAIRIEPAAADDEVLLHVTTNRPLQAAVNYTPDRRPADVRQPIMVGEYEHGDSVLLKILSAHWLIVATTGGGKSVLVHNLIARLTACANALVWIGGSSKVPTLAFGWILPWLRGEAPRPAIDRVACNARALREMLRDAYQLCDERNDRLVLNPNLDPSASEPALVVIVEEATTSLEDKELILCHDGKLRSVSDLVTVLARAGRSAGIRLVLISQTALTNTAWGRNGVEVIRLFAGRICLKTAQASDGNKMINGLVNVDTTKLTDNRMLVQVDAGTVSYAPAKAAYLEGEAVSPLAAVHADWRPDGVEVDLSPEYDARWSAEAQRELVNAAAGEGIGWPESPVHAELVPPVVEAEEGDVVVVDAAGDNTGLPELPDDVLRDLHRGLGDLLRDNSPRPPSATARVADSLFPRGESAGPAGVAESPLSDVVAWLDREQVPDAAYVLTDDAAAAVGWEKASLGRALSGQGVKVGNTPRSAGFNQRRGFRAGDARAASQK